MPWYAKALAVSIVAYAEEILAECRLRTTQLETKPRSWVGAAIIVVIWLAIAIAAVLWAMSLF